MLAWRLLWRNWRSGEVRILAGALLLAVAVVTAVAVFADRMERSLSRESNSYLAADRVIEGRLPLPDEWLIEPARFGLAQAQVAEFSSMVFAGDEMVLASVKAVGEGYPLRGQLEVSTTPFATGADVVVTQAIPARGEAWVDSRLLPQLGLSLGDQLQVGELTLTIRQLVIREPDGSRGFSVMGPRVMINLADLAATEVIQPGSRVNYRWLLAGAEGDLNRFQDWLSPQLGAHHRPLTLKEAQQGLGEALSRGGSFLMLAGMIGVLLAGVAIAIAARQFAERHIDQVALMKSLGVSAAKVRWLYSAQLLLLALLAAVGGCLLGEVMQRLIAVTIASLVRVELLAPGPDGYLVGAATGLLCLLCFALPPLWHLPQVSPLKVLRRELSVKAVQLWARGLLGVVAVVSLIGLYSRDLKLTLAVVAGLAAVLVVGGGVAWLLLRLGRGIGRSAGSVWRLALANLERQPQQSITQMLVFGAALMLLMVLFTVRTSLIEQWRLQLPDDAANHFVLNIAPHEVDPVKALLTERGINTNSLYPMVLGRIVAINGAPVTEEMRPKSNALRRELNLSWAQRFGDDNKLVAGDWWDSWQPRQAGSHGVSVEQETAEELGLKLGDRLTFSLGGLELEAEVASLRTLDWNSMRPNFFFLFSPGALDGFSPNYMTSIYLPPADKLFINQLLRSHPTLVVIEIDRIIERIRTIVDQVGKGIELVLWLVLVGGVLVLVAAVNASMAARQQDSGILRALGSGRRLILGSIGLEFAALGLFAGLLAVIGAEALLFGLQQLVFEQQASPHWWLWLAGPVGGALFIGGLGLIACRRVVTVSPWVVLRDLQG